MSKKDKCDYVLELRKSYEQWKDIYENGCNDPTWPDGVNLNLVRNHIIYFKGLIDRSTNPDNFCGLPDEYFFPEPPKVSQFFMRKDRKCTYITHIHPAEYPTVPYNAIMMNEYKEVI